MHARIQEFSSGVPDQSDKKKSSVSPKLNLQKSNGQFKKDVSFFKVPEGVQHFPGGGGGGGGEVQLLNAYFLRSATQKFYIPSPKFIGLLDLEKKISRGFLPLILDYVT